MIGDVVSGGFRRTHGWRFDAVEKACLGWIQVASVEMLRPPSRVRARRVLDYGCPRYDEYVWQALDPPTTNAAEFKPGWIEVDEEMLTADAFYYDQWREKYGGR